VLCQFLPRDALRSPKVHLLPGEHGEILEQKLSGLSLVRSFGTCHAPLFTSLDCTFTAGSYRVAVCLLLSEHHVVMFAIAQLSCVVL